MNKGRLIFYIICTALITAYVVWSSFFMGNQLSTPICKSINIYVKDSIQRQFVSEDEITRLLNVRGLNPKGKTMDNINLTEIEQTLMMNPMIKNAVCYKTPANTLNIELTQRVPKLRVMNGNESYYIDRDRHKMPTSTQHVAYVPIISGHVGYEKACTSLFDFVTFLEKDDFWNAQITQIYVRNDQKIELIPRIGNHIILLGTLDRYEQKLEKLRKLYTDGFGVIGWKNYQEIDLQYHNQVICRK